MNGVKETKMNTDEALKQIGDKDFLDRMYHFSYHRCNSSYEAEDLCAEIILTIIAALKRQEEVVNFHAFTWTIARRVYADFAKKEDSGNASLSCSLSFFSKIFCKRGYNQKC